MNRDLKYLELLSKKFPTEQAACSEIINLEAILNLPKGTEHFITDLHGENEAFQHVLRNGSGVIKQKVDDIFGDTLSDKQRKDLCTLIYYPEDKIAVVRKTIRSKAKLDEWYRNQLINIVKVLALCSAKYTRSKVRKALPAEYSYIIEELLHEWIEDNENKHNYMRSIIDTIISTGRADHFICAICNVIHRLVIDTLHIIGDIYDRGPGAHLIMDCLCDYHNFDIQWGNHDLVWMGAAAGSWACVANVLRMCFRYANLATLEDGYGINLLPLTTFALNTYKNDSEVFHPKANVYETLNPSQAELITKMHKAITVIQFKVESRVIARHPEFHMEDRNLLHRIDFEKGTVNIGGKDYVMKDCDFPTIDTKDPYALTPEEQEVIEHLAGSFMASHRLAKHMQCMLEHGSLYKVVNNNALFHGAFPLNPDGSFAEMEIQGKKYKGKALLDQVDFLVRAAYYAPEDSPMSQYGRDFIWYQWCGPVAPPFDKDKMATFERYLLSDKETHTEVMGSYFNLKNDPAICDKVLRELGVENTEHAHIINGHIPVKTKKGESPIKAGGKLLVIDGGYSKAYQGETGIAGYTLIYNSRSLKLVQHEPFESREMAVKNGMDVISETKVLEFAQRRQLVRDTDIGRDLRSQIEDLQELLKAYRSGALNTKALFLRDKSSRSLVQ